MNDGEHIDSRGLNKVNDAVGSLKHFPHILASAFRNHATRLGKDCGLVCMRENAIDQSLSI